MRAFTLFHLLMEQSAMASSRYPFVLLVVVSFALAAGVLRGFDGALRYCVGNPVACKGWTATNPLIPGYCCLVQNSLQTFGCTADEVVAYAPNTSQSCGRLYPITFSGECSFEPTQHQCGGHLPEIGCVSRMCTTVPSP